MHLTESELRCIVNASLKSTISVLDDRNLAIVCEDIVASVKSAEDGIATIKSRMRGNSSSLEEAQSVYDSAKAYHDAALQEIQGVCPHRWKFHGDPSGGNDSFYSCELCEAQKSK